MDFGERRIGIALSDDTGLIASVLTTLNRKSESKDLQSILQIANENHADEIVIGLPVLLSGKTGLQARRVLDFGNKLSNQVAIDVKYFDERFSTVEAKRLLKENNFNFAKNPARVDAVAAAVILQSYLDSNRINYGD